MLLHQEAQGHLLSETIQPTALTVRRRTTTPAKPLVQMQRVLRNPVLTEFLRSITAQSLGPTVHIVRFLYLQTQYGGSATFPRKYP